ncbi:MAG: hypothetical protein J6Y78_11485 [Paludibacteraceae bacterium]|nr:hypothetical protein [Paludibacteraceae bacterium]
MGKYLDGRQEDGYPKYVQKDLEILYNYEFDEDERYNGETDHRMARKLFQIAKNYPQKHLWAIFEYFGYFFDENGIDDMDRSFITYLDPKDYRDEIMHMAEEHFKDAMDKHDEMYDPYNNRWNEDEHTHHINRQEYFIKIGLIDCYYTRKENFKEYVYKKDDSKYFNKYTYEYKYPSKRENRDNVRCSYVIWKHYHYGWNEISFQKYHNSDDYYEMIINGVKDEEYVIEYEEIIKLADELGIDVDTILKGKTINLKNILFENQFIRYYPKIESTYI